MPDILGTKQGIATLSKFLNRSGAFTKSGTGLPRWKPPTMEDSLAAEHNMEDPDLSRNLLRAAMPCFVT